MGLLKLIMSENKKYGGKCLCFQPTDTVLCWFFFLADSLHVGFVLVGDVLDIQR